MEVKKLATKLVNILDTMAGVPKKGYNKNQNYHYIREVDVLEALKEELVKHKIILLTSSKLVDIKDKPKTDKGTVEFITTVETEHTFIDSESGEQLCITSVGQGYDSLDKGASKAITASVKYALMKTFMISDEGADIENDGVTVQAPVKTFNRSTSVDTKSVGNTNSNVSVETEVAIEGQTKPASKPSFSRRSTTKSEPNFP